MIDKQVAESDAASKTIQVNPEAEKKPTPTPTPTKEAPTKKIAKRGAQESKAPPRKRQKKEATPSEEELSDLSEPSPEESEVSESEFDEDSDEPKRKRNSKSKSKTPVKRGSKKKADTESDEEEEDEDLSDETELSDSDDSTAKRKSRPKPKAKAKAPAMRQAPAKRQSKSKAKVESSDEEKEEDNSPKKKAPAKRQSKSKAKLESSEDEEEEEASPKKATPRKAPTKKETPKKAAPFKGEPSPAVSPHKKAGTKKVGSDSKDIPKPDAGSESEMSIVLDEEPKPKRKRRSKSDMAADPKEAKIRSSSNKPGRPKSSSGSAKPAKDLTADEASIKTLQSQLKKCGVNKIWQFELKQYGDDSKEKIKHLQRVLKEIGMSGRFSEARAREIKEMRELQADLEAVKEGEKSWGLGGGKRASRAAAKAKSFKESSGSGVDDGDQSVMKKGKKEESADEGKKSESEDEQPVPRRPSARADLAFLDDEEESD